MNQLCVVMNSTINFSRFAYKATKPRLTFYERKNKENCPDASEKWSSPDNATQTHCLSARQCTPSSSGKNMSVVPETPDDERPERRGGRFARSAAATRRRKRCRVTSSEESEGESRESGAHRPTTGLFSSALASKRRKRSGELSSAVTRNDPIPDPIPDPDILREQSPVLDRYPIKLSNSNNARSTSLAKKEPREGNSRSDFRVTCKSDVVDLCSTASSDSDFSSTEEISNREMFDIESERENSPQTAFNRRYHQHKSAPTLPPPSPDEDGWLTRRTNVRKPRSKPPSSSNGTYTSGDSGDLSRLRELFPQHSDDFLRGRLRESVSVEEAIACILACDGNEQLYNY